MQCDQRPKEGEIPSEGTGRRRARLRRPLEGALQARECQGAQSHQRGKRQGFHQNLRGLALLPP